MAALRARADAKAAEKAARKKEKAANVIEWETAEQIEWWETAAFHHGVHALAILGFGLFRKTREASDLPGWLLLTGLLIFSSTLYVMALGGPRWLGAVTPVGGSLLVLGWLGFAWTARRVEA